jgi:hypothetical protein
LTRRPYWFSQKRNELHGWYHNDSYSKFQSLLIVRSRYKTLSAKLPLYISQRIALVLVCPKQTTYVSKKTCACPKKALVGSFALGAPSQDGPFTRRRILVSTILDSLNSEQSLGQLNFCASSTDKITYQSQALAI